MNLLLVTARFPFGSKESFLEQEIRELERRFTITIAPARPTGEAPSAPALASVSVRLRLLSREVLASALRELLRDPVTAASALFTVVTSPRAFHARMKNAAIFPTALALARIARKRRIDHVHAYWLSAPSTIAYVIARMNGITWSATGHRYDLVDFNVRTVGRPHAAFLSTARFVRTISNQGAAQLARAFEHALTAMHVIHLGVRLPEPAPPAQASRLRFICAANLEPVKGHADLLHAFARATQSCDAHLTLAGDGTLREALQALVRTLAIEDRVSFAGVLPHAEVLRRISAGAYDAAILTSVDDGPHQREGIPAFLMEAMAAGLPIVATRSGAIAELAGDDVGILCAPRDIEAIAVAIARLACDADLRRELGARGRSRIASEFESSRTAERLASLIQGDAA